MASRHPITGDNWTKAEEEAFNKAEFEKNLARFQSMTPQELGRTGPVHAGMGTSFSPDRWQAYIDWLKAQGMEEEAQQLEEVMETPVVGPELYWDEDTPQEEIDADIEAYEKGGPYIESDPEDALQITGDHIQNRNLKGNRDAEGNLTIINLKRDEEGKVVPSEEWLAKTKDANAKKRAALQESIAAKKDKLAINEEELAQIQAELDEVEANGVTVESEVEYEDSIENWTENFNSMSDEQFDSIKFEDLEQYGDNAMDAYTEIKLAKDKERKQAEQDRLDTEHAEREQASIDRVFDWQGQSEGAPTDKERDQLVHKDKQDFPYMNMSDEDKGMFQFKKTEDKNVEQGIDVITQDTGLSPEQARNLMTKLKGICN